MNPKVRFAIAFIENNLARHVYVEEVAQRVKLSRSRFCHLFKSETGVPFIQYLRKSRLGKACELLETTFQPIKVIALEVGYKDPAYFEREFKRVYGATPPNAERTLMFEWSCDTSWQTK